MSFLPKLQSRPKLGTLKGTAKFRLVSSMSSEERDILKEISSFYSSKGDMPTSDVRFLKNLLLRHTTGSNFSINGLSPRQLLTEAGKLSVRKVVR